MFERRLTKQRPARAILSNGTYANPLDEKRRQVEILQPAIAGLDPLEVRGIFRELRKNAHCVNIEGGQLIGRFVDLQARAEAYFAAHGKNKDEFLDAYSAWTKILGLQKQIANYCEKAGINEPMMGCSVIVPAATMEQ